MQQPILYPRPQWLRPREDAVFTLAPGQAVAACSGSRAEAEQLCRWLAQDHGLSLQVQEPATGQERIVVGRLGDEAIGRHCRARGIPVDGREAAAEGYLLDVAGDHVLVAGHDAAGTLYGLQLLRQLAVLDDGAVRVRGAEVHDWPYKPMRGVHVYMPGREQLPFFHRFLEFMAALRLNTLFLEVGGGMRYDRHPEINRSWEDLCARLAAMPGGPSSFQHAFPFPKNSMHTELGGGSYLEKDEVREILDHARELHIEVIPEVQSLSHSYYLCCAHPEIAERQHDPFPDTCCPSNPATYELLFDVLDEVIEVFRPRLVHTGRDEGYTYGLCPRCRTRSAPELIAGDIIKIHDYLAGKGVRMAMWGDKLMNIIVGGRPEGGRTIVVPPGTWFKGVEAYVMPETYPAVERVPKDILILDWYWQLDPSSEQYFGRYGFEEIYGNLGDNFCPHTFTGWHRRAAAGHVLGAEASTWCEASEYAFGRNACLFNISFSAEMLWWSHYTDRERERVLATIARLQPHLRDRLGARRSPSLQPGASFTCCSLAGAAAAAPLAALRLPTGLLELGGTPFQLEGGAAVRVDCSSPESAAIPIGASAASLLFLHSCDCQRTFIPTWQFPDPMHPSPADVLGWYRVAYEDGSQVDVEIRYGENIADRHLLFGEDIAACCYWAEPVWEGRDEEGKPLTLYRFEWINPYPEKKIEAVQLKFAGGGGGVDLSALTAVRLTG